MTEKFSNINLEIGGYPIRLKDIPREEESIYRNAEKEIKLRYEQLRKAYPHKSVPELWMLTAFHIASILHYTQTPLEQSIEELTAEIKRVLED